MPSSPLVNDGRCWFATCSDAVDWEFSNETLTSTFLSRTLNYFKTADASAVIGQIRLKLRDASSTPFILPPRLRLASTVSLVAPMELFSQAPEDS